MIDKIVRLSVERRFLFLFLALIFIGVGVWSFQRLPIDAVPDITNVQVQINYCDDIELEKSGKFRYVVSKVTV